MFKRVEKRRRRQEKEEALGLDSDLKEVLGLQDTDSDESDSSSDDQSDESDVEGEEAGPEESGTEAAGAEDEEVGSGDTSDDEDEVNEIPPMSVTEAVRDPVYLVSLDPEIKACILCTGKLLKNPVMADVHKASKAHNRRFTRFVELVQQAGPDASVTDLIRIMDPKAGKAKNATPSKRAEKRMEKLAAIKAKRAQRKEKLKKKSEAKKKAGTANAETANGTVEDLDPTPDEHPVKKRKINDNPLSTPSATTTKEELRSPQAVVSQDDSTAITPEQVKETVRPKNNTSHDARPKRRKKRKVFAKS